MKSSTMWHEARKQERLIRGMIVDYRRRAERRKDFYEKIKAEPTQFLQLHGRQCKIHLDPAIAAAGEGPAIMMPWQGDPDTMIDRFDVRAHLDVIPESSGPDLPPDQLDTEERHCNYERYRILAQNTFLEISEQKFLQQLAIEEQYGVTIEEKEAQKEKLNERKGGAAIGYNYDNPQLQPSCSTAPEPKKVEPKESDDDSDLEIIDVDLSIDVNKMEASQAHALNLVGPSYGMAGADLFSFLTGDADDAEHQKQLLREEKEKAMFSGRKSRRERRAHRDKKLAARVVAAPSYAQSQPEAARSRSGSRSRSRSVSPGDAPVQFITSFGGEDDDVKPPPPKPSYSEKVKKNLRKLELYSDVAKKRPARSPSPARVIGPRWQSRSPSCTKSPRSRSHSRTSRSRSRFRSSSRSKSRSRSRSRLSSRSYSRSSRSSRSRSRSRSRDRQRASPHNVGTSRGATSSSKPVARYYGRRQEDNSSSGLSDCSDNGPVRKPQPSARVSQKSASSARVSATSNKGNARGSRETVSLKEKLKKKMQAALARQLRADKKAEAERLEHDHRRQARRDEEMRQLAIKLRRKQREMRHQLSKHSDSESEHSRDSLPPGVSRESLSRSRSRSPRPAHELKPIPRAPPNFDTPPPPLPPDFQRQPPPPLPTERSYFEDLATDKYETKGKGVPRYQQSQYNNPQPRHNYKERWQSWQPPLPGNYEDKERDTKTYEPNAKHKYDASYNDYESSHPPPFKKKYDDSYRARYEGSHQHQSYRRWNDNYQQGDRPMEHSSHSYEDHGYRNPSDVRHPYHPTSTEHYQKEHRWDGPYRGRGRGAPRGGSGRPAEYPEPPVKLVDY